jgi:serine/threonine protein kinase
MAAAAKVMRDEPRAWDEVRHLRSMGHPNIIDLLDFFRCDGRAVLVLSLVNMNLANFLNDVPFGEASALDIMTQVLRGVDHMHTRAIVHFDLKPENIGVVISSRAKLQCKIMDFGSTVRLDRAIAGLVVHTTPEFRAPEILSGVVGTFVDVYSVGRVFELLVLKLQLPSTHPYCRLVSDMTSLDFNLRPTAKVALIQLGDACTGQSVVDAPLWLSMVANVFDGDASLLVDDLSAPTHRIVTVLFNEDTENAFWLLQEMARRELFLGSACSVLSVLPYFHASVLTSKYTAYFYARALGFLSQLSYFLLTDEMRLRLWTISTFPCCERIVLRVLARACSSELLMWCRQVDRWGSRLQRFGDFASRLLGDVSEALCLLDF